jgi:hypothetical protein
VLEDRYYRANVLLLAARLWKSERESGEMIEGSGKGKYKIKEIGGRAVSG